MEKGIFGEMRHHHNNAEGKPRMSLHLDERRITSRDEVEVMSIQEGRVPDIEDEVER